MKRTLICLAALALAALSASAQDVPPLINYQGLLSDAAGAPLASGSYDLVFSLYASPEATVAVWGPEAHEDAQVIQGRFNVILGSTIPLDGAFSGPDRWLGVSVSPEAEIAPRQRVLSTPYALSSDTSGLAANGAPPGSVMAHAGAVTPAGWLLCDGAAVSRTQYAALFAAVGTAWGAGDGSTTFNLPDLRGRFLRGVDMGEGHDPNAGSRTASNPGGNTGDAVGSVQGDATSRPNTNFTTNNPGNHHHTLTNAGGIGTFHGAAQAAQHGDTTDTTENGAHTHSVTGGGDLETRPLNAAVVWIIKI